MADKSPQEEVLALAQLKETPAVRDQEGKATSVKAGDIKRIYYDALPYRGKETRVFAWIGIPNNASKDNKAPGIVLVHGGSGTAFKEWVVKWRREGYVAISIAVEGQTDVRPGEINRQQGLFWMPHSWPGPRRVGIYGDSKAALKDQWMYHAVAGTVLANSLLRSLPMVDREKVGLMGISWGGVIASTVIGIDHRFAFAIPTYGCGNLATAANQYGRSLGKNDIYKEVWDPMVRIAMVKTPTLWLSWPGDKLFPLDKHAGNYRGVRGPYMVSLIPGMGHGHGPAWDRPESYAFAKSIMKNGAPWAQQLETETRGNSVTVKFKSARPLEKAVLMTAMGTGATGNREWKETDAQLMKRGGNWVVTARLPDGTSGWFVNVKSGNLVVSSDYHECEVEHMTASQILDVFPKSVVEMATAKQGNTTLSTNYAPSGSLWAAGLDERWVFNLEMKHTQDVENSFALRIGKGGQIYSLRGPFGESVPPSWRATPGASPWNDEVWQFVAVCLKYNDRPLGRKAKCAYDTGFFIHNSGTYTPGNSKLKNLYCPMLASVVTQDKRAYRAVNWGLVSKIKTVHRSPILYYCQTRDVGDGVVELTWVVHNFSTREDIVFDHLNAPWGGTRISSLPHHYISSPEGELRSRRDLLGSQASIDVRETGGWNISCKTTAADSPSLAFVFGRDRHLEEELRRLKKGASYCQYSYSRYRDWRVIGPIHGKSGKDWRTRPENSFRNYDVAVVIPKFRLAPDTTIWYRSFLVVNRKDKTIALAKSLVDKVDYGLVTFTPEDTPTLSVRPAEEGIPAFKLYPRPVAGSMPLFLIKNSVTGRTVVTSDPYIFVPREKVNLNLKETDERSDYFNNAFGYSMDRHSSEWQRLLGYGLVNRPESGSWVRLSEVLKPSAFPKPDGYHLDLWVERYGE